MAVAPDVIKDKILSFYNLIRDHYPIKHIFLFGSYAKGTPRKDSDIDVGVVIDEKNYEKKIDMAVGINQKAHEIDVSIEPYCILWKDYQNPENASILAEIKRTGIIII